MLVMIDNYDSFTFNLVQLIESVGGERVAVVRNDAFEPETLLGDPAVSGIVVSPGPGTPARAGRTIELIRLNRSLPLLGVCLGHQAIAEAFGAAVVRGEVPVHGKVAEIDHSESGLFRGCPRPLRATRYHSLVVEPGSLPPELTVDATTADGVVMAIRHVSRPLFGLQFHPESYGSSAGETIVGNFLGLRNRTPTA
jgi:anthranilate synthase component II